MSNARERRFDDASPDDPHLKAIERAWGLIANVDWDSQTADWQQAAIRWRDEDFAQTHEAKP